MTGRGLLRRVPAVLIENKNMDHDIRTCLLRTQIMHHNHHRQIIIEQYGLASSWIIILVAAVGVVATTARAIVLSAGVTRVS